MLVPPRFAADMLVRRGELSEIRISLAKIQDSSKPSKTSSLRAANWELPHDGGALTQLESPGFFGDERMILEVCQEKETH